MYVSLFRLTWTWLWKDVLDWEQSVPTNVNSFLTLYAIFWLALEKSDFGQTESESTFCSCGKNNQKRGSQASCQQHKDKKSNCPCVKENVCCSRKCKCRNCNNLCKSTAVSPPTKFLRCRCGETTAHRKDTGIRIVSCRDTEKKSKCPCLGSYQGCSDLCRCFNCENVHGTRLSAQFNCPRGVKKKKEKWSRLQAPEELWFPCNWRFWTIIWPMD